MGRLKTAYVGIDQSFGGFGLVALIPDGRETRFDLKAYPAAKYGAGVDRLKAVADHLAAFSWRCHTEGLDIAHICLEGYARGASHRREEAGEIAATVKLTLTACYETPACYPTIVSPSALKQFVTGKGNASKRDMVKAVREKWGQNWLDHNLADAYGLAQMAQALHTGTHNAAYPYEKSALDHLSPHTEMRPAA